MSIANICVYIHMIRIGSITFNRVCRLYCVFNLSKWLRNCNGWPTGQSRGTREIYMMLNWTFHTIPRSKKKGIFFQLWIISIYNDSLNLLSSKLLVSYNENFTFCFVESFIYLRCSFDRLKKLKITRVQCMILYKFLSL